MMLVYFVVNVKTCRELAFAHHPFVTQLFLLFATMCNLCTPNGLQKNKLARRGYSLKIEISMESSFPNSTY